MIGRCRCPFCASSKAQLRLSGKGLPYLVCDTCNVQAFARSDRSDDAMRKLLIADDAPAPAPVATAPAAAPKPPAAPAAPARVSTGWGVLQ